MKLKILLLLGISILFLSGCGARKLPTDKTELSKMTLDEVAYTGYMHKKEENGYSVYSANTLYGSAHIKYRELIMVDLEKYCKAIDGEFIGQHEIENSANAKASNIAHKKGLPNNQSCSVNFPYNSYNHACVKNKKALFLVSSDCFDSYRLETYYDKCVKNTVSKTGTYSKEWDALIDGTTENAIIIEKSVQKCIDTHKESEYAKQAKADEEKAKQKIIRQLRNRVGNYEMTFYDRYQSSTTGEECGNKCNNLNLQINGYISLNEALQNGWEPTGTVLGDDQIKPDNYGSCACIGKRLILKRTKIPKTSYYER